MTSTIYMGAAIGAGMLAALGFALYNPFIGFGWVLISLALIKHEETRAPAAGVNLMGLAQQRQRYVV